MRLNGKTVVMGRPIVLEGGKTYSVTGPGTLDADISGPTNALLRLKDCVLLNRTRFLYPKNGLRYSLENGVYLNFTEIKVVPLGLRRYDFLGVYDGAFNDVRFGGPETREELFRLKEEYVQAFGITGLRKTSCDAFRRFISGGRV